MVRPILLSALLFAVSIPSALAENTCGSSAYTQVMPEHTGISFGMSKTTALAAAKKLYRGKARVSLEDQNISITMNSKSRQVFDQILIQTLDGRVTAMTWSYSNEFQKKLGGPSDAFIAVLKKVKEKVGGADDNSKLDNGFKFVWNRKDGMSLGITGKDPLTIFMRFECNDLIDEIQKKMRDNTNMGF